MENSLRTSEGSGGLRTWIFALRAGFFTLMAANWPLMSVNVFWAMGAMSVNGLATAQLWKTIKAHWAASMHRKLMTINGFGGHSC